MAPDPGWLVLALTLVGAGVVLIVVGHRQRTGTLRLNGLVGLRTTETMRSEAAWDAAHAATAGSVTAAGIVLAVTGVVVAVLPSAREGTIAGVVVTGLAITLALVVGACVRGHRIAARVNRRGSPDPTPDGG